MKKMIENHTSDSLKEKIFKENYEISDKMKDQVEEAHLFNNGEIEGEELSSVDKAKEINEIITYHLEKAYAYQQYLKNVLQNDIAENE
jgi:hypothetical protein